MVRRIKAKFHYTGPTRPDRTRADTHGPTGTLSETRTDPTEFLGDPGRKKVRAGPVGSGRARVVEFSYYYTCRTFSVCMSPCPSVSVGTAVDCAKTYQPIVSRFKAKFHYTDPTGPARTQRSFAAKKVRAGPCGSGRVRVGSV